jgi:hypothetical protein
MPLSAHLRDRILRQLDTLTDEKGYAVLDYVEFIAARHGVPEPVSAGNLFTRFTEGIEDTMRAGKLSASAISQTMGLLNQAVGVLGGVAAAGRSVASDIVNTASDVAKSVSGSPAAPGTSPGTAPSPTTGSAPSTPTTARVDDANGEMGDNPSPS